jgi:hypothetical protein
MPVKKGTVKVKPAKKASSKKATPKKTPAKKAPKILTYKQSKFIDLVIRGVGHSEAYILAYGRGNGTPATLANNAYKLLNKPDIITILEEARKEAIKGKVCSVEWIVGKLMVESEDVGLNSSPSARVSALKQLGEYTGGFDTNKKQVDHTSSDGSMTPVREGMNAFYEDVDDDSK